MARVTVEDCILRVPNRFELVMLAAQRARDISAGEEMTVDRDNDKNPVIALREIADETIDTETLEESLVKSLQKHVEMDDPEEDEMDVIAIHQDMTNDPGADAEIAEDIAAVDGDTDAGDPAGEIGNADGEDGAAEPEEAPEED